MTSHPLIGSQVSIKPNDYAQTPVVGSLVGADENRWIIARETQQQGQVHIHFPVAGFDIEELN